MAITVKKLFKNGTFLYKMNLIAGRNGLSNLVEWVHIIEDDDVSSFLHGNELVFTAGILNRQPDWLLKFSEKLYAAGASAFVVNIGPHTKEIPKEVIAYCDEVKIPLFTIPWETRMVDMTRDFCEKIINNNHVEDSTATTLKNIIFKIGDMESQVLSMERYGYQRDSRFCFVSIYSDNQNQLMMEENKDILKLVAEKVARGIKELFLSFTYNEYLILVLVDYKEEEISCFVNDFLNQAKRGKSEWNLNVGISTNQQGIYSQDKNFEKSLSALEMARKRQETVCHYDKLGIYKLLYSVSDKVVLRSFYEDSIRKLEEYDKENHTELTLLLRTYLENNGSLNVASEKLFVHRNTVTNQLKKIEKLLGYNPLELEDKVMLFLGFYVKDLL